MSLGGTGVAGSAGAVHIASPLWAAWALLWAAACGQGSPAEPSWSVVGQDLPGALLSVWGSSADDIWAVGGDARDGTGPVVLRFYEGSWERLATGRTSGDLWWVTGFAGGPVYMGGSDGVILRHEDGEFTELETPGSGTVFGLWGSSPNGMWAVGGQSESAGGFAWRLEGERWTEEPTLPEEVADTGAIWKIHGTRADDAWLVGSNGLSFRWDGETLRPGETGVGSSLFTVFGSGGRYAAVGGLATGIIVEYDGSDWVQVTPEDPVPLSLAGVCLDAAGGGLAVGQYGGVWTRDASGWRAEELGFGLDENLHAVWIDPRGGVWSVGGRTLVAPFTDGVMIHRGADAPPTFDWNDL